MPPVDRVGQGSRAIAAVTTALAIALLAGCGDDEDAETVTAISAGDFVPLAEEFCTDGTEEATALPLPANAGAVAKDADARAEIVATVRDGLLTLGEPEGVDGESRTAYLVELETDIQQLGEIAAAARTGESYEELNATFDESAGAVAATIGLDACAAFSNAIARTP